MGVTVVPQLRPILAISSRQRAADSGRRTTQVDRGVDNTREDRNGCDLVSDDDRIDRRWSFHPAADDAQLIVLVSEDGEPPDRDRFRGIGSAVSSFMGDPERAREECDGGMAAMDRHEDDAGPGRPSAGRLRALGSTSVSFGSSRFGTSPYGLVSCGLDARTEALVRLAALVAMRAPATAYRDAVEAALEGGAIEEEVIGTLVAVAATVGLSRVVSATVALGLALGYDVDAALEEFAPSAAGRASRGSADDGF